VDTVGEITSVKIRKQTRDKLANLGRKSETYDAIIERLIEFYRKNKGGAK
jgi:hypothetical protein